MRIVSFGTDSEFLVFEQNTGKFVPAYKFIHGTKDKPQKIADFDRGELFAHWDNVALEITATPMKEVDGNISNKYFGMYLQDVYNATYFWLKETHPNLMLTFNPVVEIDEETMFDNEANIFGCEPDYNIWTMKKNPSPSPMKAGKLRTAGAHLHFGLDSVTDDAVLNILRAVDNTAGGMMGYLTAPEQRAEHFRRSLYGMAGSFRRKDYGVEARVFSPLLFKYLRYFNILFPINLSAAKSGGETAFDYNHINFAVNGHGFKYYKNHEAKKGGEGERIFYSNTAYSL